MRRTARVTAARTALPWFMVELRVEGEVLAVEVKGWHRLLALRRRIEVPVAAVRAVRRLPADAIDGWWKGWRVPGTHLPGVIIAGTYYKDGEKHFWDVRHADHGVEIVLQGELFDRLYVEVADPDAAIAALDAARGFRS